MPTSTPTPKADDLCLFCDARRGDHYDGTGGAYPDHACPQDGSFSHSLTFAPRSACAHGVQRGQRCHECEKLAELGVPGAKFAISPPSPLPADATAEQKKCRQCGRRYEACTCAHWNEPVAEQAGKPTEGPWHTGGTFTPNIHPRQNVWGPTPKGCESGELICERAKPTDAALIAEAGTVYHETGLTPGQLADRSGSQKQVIEIMRGELDTAREECALLLGSERELSGMLGDCAGILGLDPAVHTPRDIVPALDALKDECAQLKEELTGIHGALRNFEINGSDAAAQIIGIYRDGDETSAKCRALTREREDLLVALEKISHIAK